MKTRTKFAIVSAVTFARLPLVLLFVVGALAHVKYGHPWLFYASFVCVVISAVTDAFDGFMARKMGVESRIGAYADPLLDKFFYIATMPVLIFVAATNGNIRHAAVLAVLAIFFLVRDQWVSFLRSVGAEHGVSGKAHWAGKVRTGINFTLICTVYYYEEYEIKFLHQNIIYAFEALGFIANLFSAHVYTRRYWPSLKKSIKE